MLEIRPRGPACLHFLKIKTLPSIFYRKRIRNKVMSHSGKMNGEVKCFSHGTRHSKGTCVLLNPAIQDSKIKNSLSDNLGRIVLINSILNGLELSLCNIYSPNDQAEQLRFIEELNNYLIDQSELMTLIIGGDWNCTLTKKDKKGGLPWRPTGFRNLILITMDIFDLVDMQRVKHPNINKYSYVSKALKMRSRMIFSCGKKFNQISQKS